MKDYHLKVHTDPEVTPVAQPQHCVLFHICKDEEKKLKELQDVDTSEAVEGQTLWVSPLVAIPKLNRDVQVCFDITHANEAVIREQHPIPVLKETLQVFNGAAGFSKHNLHWGYPQDARTQNSCDVLHAQGNAFSSTHRDIILTTTITKNLQKFPLCLISIIFQECVTIF